MMFVYSFARVEDGEEKVLDLQRQESQPWSVPTVWLVFTTARNWSKKEDVAKPKLT